MHALLAAVAADLISEGPVADQAVALAAFAPLVGSWDLRYVYRRATGERIAGNGYAHFGWGLGGRAIVDIWGFQDGAVGTTIRYYDPKIDSFRSTWICPARNAFVPFIGRAIDGRIVLHSIPNDPPGRRIRWSFVSIETERFSWTGEVSDDGGTSWLLTQEIEATRRVAPSGAAAT
jgi:hypothetical protein